MISDSLLHGECKMEKKLKHDWVQTWANYYEYVTRNMNAEKIHEILAEERRILTHHILRAEEHLAGIELFYNQSPLTDPNPPEKKEKDTGVLSNSDAGNSSDTACGTAGHSRELSNRSI